MFTPDHFGLYFTDVHVGQAQKHKNQSPFRDAWECLTHVDESESLVAVQRAGLRYRFCGDTAAGEWGISVLNVGMFSALVYESLLKGLVEYRDAIRGMVALGQCFELFHNHPASSDAERVRRLEIFSGYVDHLRHQVYSPTVLETLWLGVLNLTAGIILERKEWFDTGATIYRHAINTAIHPEGYLVHVVDESYRCGLEGQLSGVMALVLSAEAASHVGVDLWKHCTRGISVLTAAAYTLDAYFHPEKWAWDDMLTSEHTKNLFRRYGGFLEIVNRYLAGSRDTALEKILKELRPIYDCYGGGLTTLSHALPRQRWFS